MLNQIWKQLIHKDLLISYLSYVYNNTNHTNKETTQLYKTEFLLLTVRMISSLLDQICSYIITIITCASPVIFFTSWGYPGYLVLYFRAFYKVLPQWSLFGVYWGFCWLVVLLFFKSYTPHKGLKQYTSLNPCKMFSADVSTVTDTAAYFEECTKNRVK